MEPAHELLRKPPFCFFWSSFHFQHGDSVVRNSRLVNELTSSAHTRFVKWTLQWGRTQLQPYSLTPPLPHCCITGLYAVFEPSVLPQSRQLFLSLSIFLNIVHLLARVILSSENVALCVTLCTQFILSLCEHGLIWGRGDAVRFHTSPVRMRCPYPQMNHFKNSGISGRIVAWVEMVHEMSQSFQHACFC